MEMKDKPPEGYELVSEGKIGIDWIYFIFDKWVYVGDNKFLLVKEPKEIDLQFAKKK